MIIIVSVRYIKLTEREIKMNETLKTIEREKMIETTKEAYKVYKVIRKNYPYNFEDINFAYTKYFFYMKRYLFS